MKPLSTFLLALCLSATYSVNAYAGTPVVLPISIINASPAIELKLNGRPYTFMLDTGSSEQMHLDESIAKEIAGLRYTGKKRKSIDLAGKNAEDAEFLIPELNVNGMHLHNVAGIRYSPWGIIIGTNPNTNPWRAVLGLGFFQDKQLLIDLAKRTLTISDDENTSLIEKTSGWKQLHFKKMREGVVIKLTDPQTPYQLVLDSGASQSMIKNKLVNTRTDLKECRIDLGPGQPPCRMLGIQFFENMPASFATIENVPDAFKADGLLGMDFFSQCELFLDLRNNQLWVHPNGIPKNE